MCIRDGWRFLACKRALASRLQSLLRFRRRLQTHPDSYHIHLLYIHARSTRGAGCVVTLSPYAMMVRCDLVYALMVRCDLVYTWWSQIPCCHPYRGPKSYRARSESCLEVKIAPGLVQATCQAVGTLHVYMRVSYSVAALTPYNDSPSVSDVQRLGRPRSL